MPFINTSLPKNCSFNLAIGGARHACRGEGVVAAFQETAWHNVGVRVGLAAVLLAVATAGASVGQAPAAGDRLPPWQPGMLDIHQIATGRGNVALSVFPDGTTMLVDAGDASTPGLSARPDASRTLAQWIARYVRHMLGDREARLDYAVLTHFHPDHIGAIAGVAGEIPIATIIDRGDAYLTPPAADVTYASYRRFIAANPGITRRTAEAGSTSLIGMRSGKDQAFETRIVSVNDRVWTGTTSKVRFPSLDTIAMAEDRPTENMCSVTLRIKYGAFDYFTGGDQPGYPNPGNPAWHDLETDVAGAIGATDVHVVNHHGSIEAENPFWLKTLASRVMIVPAWSTTHPSPDVLKRMLATRLYPSPRDVFVTSLRPETKATIGPRAEQVASGDGHVVVRVEPGGKRYWVFVLDNSSESYRITLVRGPYAAE